MLVQESLGLSVPRVELFGPKNIGELADRDLALDRTMIPLGSCTMKLNATTEMVPITWPGFSGLHPYAPVLARALRRAGAWAARLDDPAYGGRGDGVTLNDDPLLQALEDMPPEGGTVVIPPADACSSVARRSSTRSKATPRSAASTRRAA